MAAYVIPELHVRSYLPRFYHNNLLLYRILSFYEFITLANTTCKLPEDGVLIQKYVEVI